MTRSSAKGLKIESVRYTILVLLPYRVIGFILVLHSGDSLELGEFATNDVEDEDRLEGCIKVRAAK